MDNSIPAKMKKIFGEGFSLNGEGRERGALGERLQRTRKKAKGLLVSYVVWCVHGRSSGITDSQ